MGSEQASEPTGSPQNKHHISTQSADTPLHLKPAAAPEQTEVCSPFIRSRLCERDATTRVSLNLWVYSNAEVQRWGSFRPRHQRDGKMNISVFVSGLWMNTRLQRVLHKELLLIQCRFCSKPLKQICRSIQLESLTDKVPSLLTHHGHADLFPQNMTWELIFQFLVTIVEVF